jgi:hypothetical protein
MPCQCCTAPYNVSVSGWGLNSAATAPCPSSSSHLSPYLSPCCGITCLCSGECSNHQQQYKPVVQCIWDWRPKIQPPRISCHHVMFTVTIYFLESSFFLLIQFPIFSFALLDALFNVICRWNSHCTIQWQQHKYNFDCYHNFYVHKNLICGIAFCGNRLW